MVEALVEVEWAEEALVVGDEALGVEEEEDFRKDENKIVRLASNRTS